MYKRQDLDSVCVSSCLFDILLNIYISQTQWRDCPFLNSFLILDSFFCLNLLSNPKLSIRINYYHYNIFNFINLTRVHQCFYIYFRLYRLVIITSWCRKKRMYLTKFARLLPSSVNHILWNVPREYKYQFSYSFPPPL